MWPTLAPVFAAAGSVDHVLKGDGGMRASPAKGASPLRSGTSSRVSACVELQSSSCRLLFSTCSTSVPALFEAWASDSVVQIALLGMCSAYKTAYGGSRSTLQS